MADTQVQFGWREKDTKASSLATLIGRDGTSRLAL
jgi:hypothetical protein